MCPRTSSLSKVVLVLLMDSKTAERNLNKAKVHLRANNPREPGKPATNPPLQEQISKSAKANHPNDEGQSKA